MTAIERLMAAAMGISKPYLVGNRWSSLDRDETWESVEDSRMSPSLVMPFERLLRLLAGRLHFIGTAPKHLGGESQVPQEVQDAWYDLRFGVPLASTLDPPQWPDDDTAFPSELWVVEAAHAARSAELVTSTCDTCTATGSGSSREEGPGRGRADLRLACRVPGDGQRLTRGEDILVVRSG